ncbi:MAG TPA: hypothetical protein VFO12_11825 [Sphingomicrobium sp.]|nr:hypothetical protein [Sphingomicrobium sp.]
MQDRIFGDREKALEESYFRQEEAKLLEKLRQRASLDEIALALGEKLQVDNAELLERVRTVGVKLDTAPALFLGPLVQVAWADGTVSRKEHQAVLRLAGARGVEEGSPAYAQLEEWLRVRPADELFDVAVEVLKYSFSVLTQAEREDRVKRLLDACHEVASASGKGMATLLALGNTVVPNEQALLDALNAAFRKRPG